MDSEDRKYLWLPGIFCATIVIIILILVISYDARVKMYIENGYTRKRLIGCDYPQWVKEEENKDE